MWLLDECNCNVSSKAITSWSVVQWSTLAIISFRKYLADYKKIESLTTSVLQNNWRFEISKWASNQAKYWTTIKSVGFHAKLSESKKNHRLSHTTQTTNANTRDVYTFTCLTTFKIVYSLAPMPFLESSLSGLIWILGTKQSDSNSVFQCTNLLL